MILKSRVGNAAYLPRLPQSRVLSRCLFSEHEKSPPPPFWLDGTQIDATDQHLSAKKGARRKSNASLFVKRLSLFKMASTFALSLSTIFKKDEILGSAEMLEVIGDVMFKYSLNCTRF